MKDLINHVLLAVKAKWVPTRLTMSFGHAPSGTKPPTLNYYLISSPKFAETFSGTGCLARIQIDVRVADHRLDQAMSLSSDVVSTYDRAALTMPVGSSVQPICCKVTDVRCRFETDTRTWLVSHDIRVAAHEPNT